MLEKIAIGVAIVATIIGFFDLDLAIKILVNSIILACLIAVLFRLSGMFRG